MNTNPRPPVTREDKMNCCIVLAILLLGGSVADWISENSFLLIAAIVAFTAVMYRRALKAKRNRENG